MKNLEFFIFYFTPGNSRHNKTQHLDIPHNCVRSVGNSKFKNKDPLEIQLYFFLVTLGNSTLFLIISPIRKFCMLFLWYPWKFHIMNPPVCIFSGIVELHLSHAISYEQYSLWSWFLVYLCKMMISPGIFFFIFLIFSFLDC